MKTVENFYDHDPQYEWERMSRHRTEFGVTFRALADYLPLPSAKILDIGGGPGRYAMTLAEQGHDVTLLDLSQKNLDFAQQKVKEMNVSLCGFVHGNAIQLPLLPHEQYDAVLMFGSLYHLTAVSDRNKAIEEAMRVLKPNGLLFVAFITRMAPIRDTAIRHPQWIVENRALWNEMVEHGVNRSGKHTRFTDAYFAWPDEIRPFMEAHQLKTITQIGVEGLVAGHEAEINQLQGELFEGWVEINYQIGQRTDTFGASDHILYIGQK